MAWPHNDDARGPASRKCGELAAKCVLGRVLVEKWSRRCTKADDPRPCAVTAEFLGGPMTKLPLMSDIVGRCSDTVMDP